MLENRIKQLEKQIERDIVYKRILKEENVYILLRNVLRIQELYICSPRIISHMVCIHDSEKFYVQHALKDRQKNSLIIYMQNSLKTHGS